MNYAAVIKLVGRGRDSARAIGRDEARELFGDMLDDRVQCVHLGALLLAYRLKGESADELAGFLDAVHARLPFVASPEAAPRTVVIPSYNGARTMANLVPLLALSLAARGVPVLVHGVTNDESRVTSAAIFTALGMTACTSGDAAARALASERVAFMPLGALSPGLDRLLDLRWTLGVRNSAHTVVKMLRPVMNALGLVSVTHPEYLATMREYYAAHPADTLLMRGTQGEAVANARRAQAIEWLHDGRAHTVIEAWQGSALALPELPSIDAASTAQWTLDVLAGRLPMPAPIARQVEVIERIATRCDAPREIAA